MNCRHFLFLGLTAPLWLPIVLVVGIVGSAFLPLFTDATRARRVREAIGIGTNSILIGDKRVLR